MRRNDYDDLMGLDMYDEGMGALMSPEMLTEQLIAAGSSALAIIVSAWGVPKVPMPKDWQPVNQSRARAVLTAVAGALASRGLWNYNRDAALAVLGGVSGLALAQLVDTFLDMDILHGSPLGQYDENSLSASDEALLTAYSPDTRTLSLTEVNASRPAFSQGGMHGTMVTPEQLMGTVVATDTLGEQQYQGYLA